MRCRAHSLDTKDGEITTPIATIIASITMRNVFSLCFSIFVFLSCFLGKPSFSFLSRKKRSFPLFFGRSSITSSHSETRIPIAFFCMPDLRALPLRFTCICPVLTLSVSSERFSQNACKYSLLLLVKIGKPKIAEHVLLHFFICYLS